jgi:hypothetical protein
LIATCGSSCSTTSATQVVTVHGSPKVTFADQSPICANHQPITFTTATQVSGPTGGTWTYSGVGVNNSNTMFDPSKVQVGTTSITSTIKAVYTTPVTPTWGCKDSATSNIYVKAIVDLGFDPTTFNLCKTDSIHLNPITNTGITFSWSESDGLNTIRDVNTRRPWVIPVSDNTVYTVVASNPNYCSSTATVTVHASPYPQVKISTPITDTILICYGTTTPLEAAITTTSATPTIVWTPADLLSTANNLKSVIANTVDTTIYIVKVTDNSYCTKSVSDTVVVNVLPKFNVAVHVGSDTSTQVTVGDSLHMLAYIVDTAFKTPVKYTWLPSTYLDNKDTSSPVLFATTLPLTFPKDSISSIKYYVTATTNNDQHCQATADFTVTFFAIQPDVLMPSAFAPGSSIAVNRVLIPNPIGITHFEYFRVFNRGGQLVFSTNKVGEGWDGTINGVPADPGTYVWMVSGVDYKHKRHTQSNTVVLMR